MRVAVGQPAKVIDPGSHTVKDQGNRTRISPRAGSCHRDQGTQLASRKMTELASDPETTPVSAGDLLPRGKGASVAMSPSYDSHLMAKWKK